MGHKKTTFLSLKFSLKSLLISIELAKHIDLFLCFLLIKAN